MLRFFGFVAFLLLLLIVGMLTIVRAAPAADADLRTLLAGDGDCQVPCWMGITVGSTSVADARQRLETHPWVERVIETPTTLIWRWNGSQPTLINGDQDGLFKLGGGIVRQVRVQTSVPFGAIWLVLAQPDDVLLVRQMSRYSAFQIANYANAGIQVISTISCPIDPTRFWEASTTLGIGEIWTNEALNGRQFNIYNEAGWWRSLRKCAVVGN